MPKVYTMY